MTTAEWLLRRLDWRPELRVLQNSFGTWDVMLQLDGDYTDQMDALRSVGALRAELCSLIEQARLDLGEPDAA